MKEPSFSSENVAQMIRRTLNLVDPHLIDHGIRVSFVVDAMLETEGSICARDREEAHFLALFHDIGAYQTEEIERMIAFETESVWEHAIYGYLFMREFSPFWRLSEVVLYHHMAYDQFDREDPLISRLSQVLHVADRVDVLIMARSDISSDQIIELLQQQRGKLFSPEAIDLFIEANEANQLVEGLKGGVDFGASTYAYKSTDSKPLDFLQLLVRAVDFRSHHTVTHTIMTAWIGYCLARCSEMELDDCDQIFYGALMHDLGKVGIPIEILEKPGKLTPEEVSVMRTHVDITESIIKGCVDESTARISLRHHEKLDGSGYPRGLMGNELSQSERILVVADMVSALAGTRSYKKSYSRERVLAIVNEQEKLGLIDSGIVSVLVSNYDDIMTEVGQRGKPIQAAYERVQKEYITLLGELS